MTETHHDCSGYLPSFMSPDARLRFDDALLTAIPIPLLVKFGLGAWTLLRLATPDPYVATWLADEAPFRQVVVVADPERYGTLVSVWFNPDRRAEATQALAPAMMALMAHRHRVPVPEIVDMLRAHP